MSEWGPGQGGLCVLMGQGVPAEPHWPPMGSFGEFGLSSSRKEAVARWGSVSSQETSKRM